MKNHQSMQMKFYIFLFIFFGLFLLESQAQLKGSEDQIMSQISGQYMGMGPTATPKLLAPVLLASSLQEYNGTFNPKGTLFFFTTNTPSQGIICYTRMRSDKSWSEPKIAEFSGVYSEYDPVFSPDGSKLYFSSERPITDSISQQQTNIWYIEKTGDTWTEPSYVDLGGHGNYYNSLTNDGIIYFNVWNNGDMFKAIPNGDSYKVQKLSSILNSDNGEGDPFISPDEDYLIFRGYNNSLGNGDLYISYFIKGQWTEPENLGEPINSTFHEMCPYVTVDKKYFIFSSSRLLKEYNTEAASDLKDLRNQHASHDNGELNIYYMSANFIEEKRLKFIE